MFTSFISEQNTNTKYCYVTSIDINQSGDTYADVPWNEYAILAFSVSNYGNYANTVVVPSSYFAQTSEGNRVMIYFSSMTVEIMKNGDQSIKIVTSGSMVSNASVKINGFIKL